MDKIAQLKKEQQRIKEKVIVKDRFNKINYIGGADVSFDKQYAYGCIVVMKIDDFSIVDYAVSKSRIQIPYIPTFLSFREQGPIVLAYQKLKVKPDILMCDGQGIAHPRHAGLACAVGTYLNIPTIGVAKTKLCGNAKEPLPDKNRYSFLYYRSKKVGIILRTQTGVKPLYVSPGHKVSIKTARKIVIQCLSKYRLPEPIRYAHHISNLFKQRKLRVIRKIPKRLQ